MPDAAVAARSSETTNSGTTQQVDVAVVGAGFAGLYLLHRLRKAGFSTVVIEEAGDVGGTWYWNRYPGARCDIQTIDYSYTFDPELESAWKWSEKYATQPEILRYLGFVADRYELRRDIRFRTKVTAANWDQSAERWRLTTDNGASISCRHYIMATGCLSAPKPPEIDGVKDFKGEIYFTGRRSSPSSSAPRTSLCPPITVLRRRTAWLCWKATAPAIASRRAGRSRASPIRNKCR